MRTLLCRRWNEWSVERRERKKTRKSSMWLFDFEIKIGKVCIGDFMRFVEMETLNTWYFAALCVTTEAAKMIYIFVVCNEKSIGFKGVFFLLLLLLYWKIVQDNRRMIKYSNSIVTILRWMCLHWKLSDRIKMKETTTKNTDFQHSMIISIFLHYYKYTSGF